jgi:hypothetical protein
LQPLYCGAVRLVVERVEGKTALKSRASPGGPWGWPSFLAPMQLLSACARFGMRPKYLPYVEELELVERTLVTIQRTAATLAKLPVEDRAEAFHEFCRAYALAMDQDTSAAAKWVEPVMTGVRNLVIEIDKSGGRYLNVMPRLTP